MLLVLLVTVREFLYVSSLVPCSGNLALSLQSLPGAGCEATRQKVSSDTDGYCYKAQRCPERSKRMLPNVSEVDQVEQYSEFFTDSLRHGFLVVSHITRGCCERPKKQVMFYLR
jgi:hypothetical protein